MGTKKKKKKTLAVHFLEMFCPNLGHIPLQALQRFEEHLHASLPAARGGTARSKVNFVHVNKEHARNGFLSALQEVSWILQETCVWAQCCLSPPTDECELAKSDKNKQTSCGWGHLAAAAGVPLNQ